MSYKRKSDQAAASKKHYEQNKVKIKARSKKRNIETRKANRKYITFVKNLSGCVDCGEDNPVVLDFDHIRGTKKHNVSDMASSSYSFMSIQKEIDKCEVRCANCHRKVTHARRCS